MSSQQQQHSHTHGGYAPSSAVPAVLCVVPVKATEVWPAHIMHTLGKHKPTVVQDRADVWQKTGIAAMRDAGLAQLPEELWAVAHALRVSPKTHSLIEHRFLTKPTQGHSLVLHSLCH